MTDPVVAVSLESVIDLYRDLPGVAAELALGGSIILFLLLRMTFPKWRQSAYFAAFMGSLLAFGLAMGWNLPEAREAFGGLLIHDAFGQFFRVLLLGFLVLFVIFTMLSRFPPFIISTEFFLFVFSGILGMCLMARANHLLLVVLTMEMASLPSYALAGIRRLEPRGTEAALKFAVFGAVSSGLMFFGLSLLSALTGSLHLAGMSAQLSERLGQLGNHPAELSFLAAALVLAGAGLAFKLSLVPFHFWTPDVFEGATAEVGTFLSVASKLAVLALFIRLLTAWVAPLAVGSLNLGMESPGPFIQSFVTSASEIDMAANGVLSQKVALILGIVGGISCTFGNLVAFGQTNIKRLLAYSTIAHGGYITMGLAGVTAALGAPREICQQVLASVLFYAIVYLLMNLGIFAVATFLRNKLSTEEIDKYRGWGRHDPVLLITATVFLFSLVGLPPFAGFIAKFALFAALAQARLWWLVVLGVINTVLSLFYYLRIVKVLAFEKGDFSDKVTSDQADPSINIFLLSLAGMLLLLGVWWQQPFHWCMQAAQSVLVY